MRVRGRDVAVRLVGVAVVAAATLLVPLLYPAERAVFAFVGLGLVELMARQGRSILLKLLLAYVLPTVILFVTFAYYSYDLLRRDADAELSRRLEGVAAATAALVRGKYLIDVDPAEGAEARAVKNTRRKLEAVVARAGLERATVFGPDRHALCDTREDVAFGGALPELELDRTEVAAVLERGAVASSVTYQGSDGRLRKAGYAPVAASEEDGTIVAGLRVEAPAAYFGKLALLSRRLVTHAAVLAAAVVLVSLLVATLLTRPLRRLSATAQQIARGDLGAPVPTAGGDEIGALAHSLDEMLLALRARDERLQMMLAGIAHEVRNPLGGIELYAGILREELAGDDGRLAHLARIERELGHLKAVVNDFLEYARRPKPELRPVRLAALVDEVRDLVAADAGPGLALSVEVDGEPVALADPVQLRRALLNLARNAVQATAAGGRVTLTAGAQGEHVAVGVTDTGRGIAPEELERIFAPFYTTREKGTGLGLAFAREIILDHGGELRVESAVGKGSTFTILLRSSEPPPQD